MKKWIDACFFPIHHLYIYLETDLVDLCFKVEKEFFWENENTSKNMSINQCKKWLAWDKSDGKSQEPCDFVQMWDMKLKATNKQDRQTKPRKQRQQLWWLNLGGGWGEVEEGKGDKWWWKETWLRGVNTQCNIQMMHYRPVHLKSIQFY